MEFFQFNGKKASFLENVGKGKGKRKPPSTIVLEEEQQGQELEELDYDSSVHEDVDEEEEEVCELFGTSSSSSSTAARTISFTPANTPTHVIANGSVLTTGGNVCKKRKIFDDGCNNMRSQLEEMFKNLCSVFKEENEEGRKKYDALVNEKKSIEESTKQLNIELVKAKEASKKIKNELEKERKEIKKFEELKTMISKISSGWEKK